MPIGFVNAKRKPYCVAGVKLCDFGAARRSRDARYYRVTVRQYRRFLAYWYVIAYKICRVM
jgi:hypothetical protein